MAVVDGFLTSVGSWKYGRPTNTLLSLTGEGAGKQWSDFFPPMPTPRCNFACVTTQHVAGGFDGICYLDTVEVMNTDTKFRTRVASLPEMSYSLTATVFGGRLYFAGRFIGSSKSVFTCSLSDLLTYNTLGSRLRWSLISSRQNMCKKISSLSVTHSALVSVGGHLLAVGGRDFTDKLTSDVYRYNSHTDSWTVASQMNNKRSCCFAVTFVGDHLVVVGGETDKRGLFTSPTVEILK